MKKYTQSHEWIDSSTGKVGISAHALEALGEIVFLELPKPGQQVNQSNSVAVIESHKAASDIYTPVSGVVTTINQNAADNPEKISNDEDIYLFTISDFDPDQLSDLMDADAYKDFLSSEGLS